MKFLACRPFSQLSLVILAVAGFGMFVMAQDESATQPISELTALRGARVIIRDANKPEDVDKAQLRGFEWFRDERFGTLMLVGDSGDVTAMPFPKSYELRTARVGSKLVLVRFMPRLGSAWGYASGQWIPIEESAPEELLVGDYDVVINTTSETRDVIRIEQVSGATWVLEGVTWQKVGEPEASESS